MSSPPLASSSAQRLQEDGYEVSPLPEPSSSSAPIVAPKPTPASQVFGPGASQYSYPPPIIPLLDDHLRSPSSSLTSPPPTLPYTPSSRPSSSMGLVSDRPPPSHPPTSVPSSRRQSIAGHSEISFFPQRMVRIPSEETRALSLAQMEGKSPRGSVILYKLEQPELHGSDVLLPPHLPFTRGRRGSTGLHSINDASTVASGSRNSLLSFDFNAPLFRGPAFVKEDDKVLQLVAYAYQPDALLEGEDDGEDDDWLHDPRVPFYGSPAKDKQPARSGYNEEAVSTRGLVNYSAIWVLLVGLIALFVIYPITVHYTKDGVAELISHNDKINSTGQATERRALRFTVPEEALDLSTST